MQDREEAYTDVCSDHTFTAGFASSRQILSAEDAEVPPLEQGNGESLPGVPVLTLFSKTLQN